MLQTETNTPEMYNRVLSAAQESDRITCEPLDIAPYFEHGQWWITCNACGAQWSVVDATGGPSIDGFDFEQVTEGDEQCFS